MSRWGLSIAALLAIAACQPTPQLPHLTVAPAATTAHLTLRLELPGRGRALQYIEGTERVHIKIEGPGLTTPYEKLIVLASTGATLVSLTDVPTGTHRLIAVQCLDAENQPIPGALLRTVGAINAGANTLALSQATTAVGEVASKLMALDKEKATNVLAKVTWSAAETAIATYAREGKAAHFALLDATAIANAVHSANGTFPAFSAGLVRTPGVVELRPASNPPYGGYIATVDDPASRPAFLGRGTPLTIEGVAPGTWTLTLTPVAPGLAKRTQSVQVVAGATVTLPIAFSDSAPGTSLSAPLGPGAAAVLPVGGTDMLVAIAGTTYADATGLQAVENLVLLGAGGTQTAGPSLSAAATVVQTAAAVHGGKLYWFGGRNATEPVGTGLIYDPAVTAAPASTAPLPGGLALRGATAGAIGDTIYLTGGLKADEATFNTDVLAYAPAGNTWGTAPLPALTPARTDMASAVVGGVWYLFGGAAAQAAFSNGAPQVLLVATRAVSAFTPGANARWDAREPMPTARSGAGTAVVNGKIWVIGGAGLMGQPSAAVEVYDPATNTWTVKPPLRRARAFPAVGVLNGKISVIGGIDGADPLMALPLAEVEVLTP